jgi:L-glutamine-phosphate cytidylyltransferase
VRIVILAAGVGSRLGSPLPKPLTRLADGRTILERQVDGIASAFDVNRVMIVVGFKKDLIMEDCPGVAFVYNQDFGETNTSKSLLRALELTLDEAVLWMNGDVVFEPELMVSLRRLIDAEQSFVCVNTESVGAEEVKYRADAGGRIVVLSKEVEGAAGEAVGINFVAAADKDRLVKRLRECEPSDYFERGMERAIECDGVEFVALDVGSATCIEIDFPEDLARANVAIRKAD